MVTLHCSKIPFFPFYLVPLITIFFTCAPEARLDSEPNEIRIIATDDGYDMPDSIRAGLVHLTFENKGSTIHEALFSRLPEGMSAFNYLEAVSNGSLFPEGALDYSGPGLSSAGENYEMWLTLDPGDYLMGCWFDSHLTSIAPQTVTVYGNSTNTSDLPQEDAILKMIDYKFVLDRPLKKGTQILKVETIGPSMHEVDFFRLHPDITFDDFWEWQHNDRKGPSPATAIGGVLSSHDITRVVWIKQNYEVGRHVIWCGMPLMMQDSSLSDDVAHADLGMYLQFEIKD